MVRNAIRYYAWATASWLVRQLDPVIQPSITDAVMDNDEMPAWPPSSLDEEGWGLLYMREPTVVTSERVVVLEGSFASRMQRELP